MPKKTVLIVEDEKPLNEAYQVILEAEGYKVASVYDGAEALEVTKDMDPDLILLDLRMPQINGIEFLKKYDAPGKHPKVKIIVFSNLDTENEINEAYKLGAHKYMLKAWASPKELARLVKETIG